MMHATYARAHMIDDNATDWEDILVFVHIVHILL